MTVEGSPSPLGVTQAIGPDGVAGVNVAVWAPEATRVWFCLFEREDSEVDRETKIPLTYRDGEIWHGFIAGIGPGARYGFRADGPHEPTLGLRFNRHKLLIDPYAKSLDGVITWHPHMLGFHAGPEGDLTFDTQDSAGVTPKGIVWASVDHAAAGVKDPHLNRPHHRLEDLVVYETHVKGISALHPGVPDEIRGTYLGMAHHTIIEHLVSLGVTAVELLPLQAFIDDEHVVQRGLRNYWGYQPIGWFAAEPRYARYDAHVELRHLVHTLHEASIEVIVDVVFNHSGEGDEFGATLGMRGLHNRGYYRLVDEGRHYVNDTGTGNTLATDRPMVMRLVLDALRHWVTHFGVDGFRFDLATVLGRNDHGIDVYGPLFQAIGQDPVLQNVKLIAEPWDLGPGGYLLGRFAHPWAEWNDRYRDGVRKAWRGDSMGLADLASRLLGSADFFDHSHRHATSSVNFVTAHDGFTLADLVSFSEKHNEANGEDGRDGHDDNYSENFGVEGVTNDTRVLAARDRRRRALLATLFVSQGVPMLLSGDEIGNSQGGNNNAYSQDNPIGWINWSNPDTEFQSFVRKLIAMRRRLPLLRQRAFLHGSLRTDGHLDVVWRRADGQEISSDDWQDPGLETLVVEMRGAAGDPVGEAETAVVLLVLNTGAECVVTLPAAPSSAGWQLELDSERPDSVDTAQHEYRALEQSVVVFSAR